MIHDVKNMGNRERRRKMVGDSMPEQETVLRLEISAPSGFMTASPHCDARIGYRALGVRH